MQPFNHIKEYCTKVSEQIRWTKAKAIVVAEIENHLCDQRDAYMLGGDDETIATEKAIAQMGDAVFVGQELDKTNTPKTQWLMMVLTGIFMLVGVSFNYLIDISVHSSHTFNVLPYIFSFVLFLCCYYIDFSILGKYSKQIYGFVLILSIIGVLLGTGVNGRLTWIAGRFAVSLSYLSLIFPLAFALFVYSMRDKGWQGILISAVAYLPLALVLLLIPSITGLILYTTIAVIVLCFAICRGWFNANKKHGLLLVLLPTIAVFICLTITILSYASSRINIFLNPEQDRFGAGYLYCLIRGILSGAVFFGTGDLPLNIENITMLPNLNTDFSLVYLIHKFGFVILFGIIVLVAIFSVVGVHKALKEKSVLGSLIALTIVLTFILQAISYIICNLGYGLFSPLSLPFISHGRCALFINSALIGFMLSVFRTGEIFRDSSFLPIKSSTKHYNSILSYQDGKLIITLKGERS